MSASITPKSRIALNVLFIAVLVSINCARLYVVRYITNKRFRAMTAADIVCNISLLFGMTVGIVASSFDILAKVWELEDYPPDTILMPILNVPIDRGTTLLKNLVFHNYAYILALWCAKTCLLSMFFNLFPALSSGMRIYIKLVAGVVLVTLVFLLTALSFWCRPFSSQWEFGENFCNTGQNTDWPIICFIVHIITDLLVFSVAVMLLFKLKLGSRERYALGFVIGLGVCTMIAAVLRLYFTLSLTGKSDEKNFIFPSDVYVASAFEVVVACVVVCMPSFKVLIRRWLENRSSRNQSSKRNSNGPAYEMNNSYHFEVRSAVESPEIDRCDRKSPIVYDGPFDERLR